MGLWGRFKMVSMKDIARECGVSVAAVSKALSGQPDISEATRDKIRKAAESMGYQPNSAAKVLRTHRSNNIGVLFFDEAGNGLTNEFFALLLDRFKAIADDKGYDITFINRGLSSGSVGNMNYLAHARYRAFDGVLIACMDFHDPEVIELAKSDIPLVTIDYSFEDRMSVVSDNVSGIKELVQYCARMGHKKIAYIHDNNESAVTRDRVKSFLDTMESLGLEVPEEYMPVAEYRRTENSRKATEKLLRLEDRPTCILYPDDFSTLGGIAAIKAAGLEIPRDISIVGYDGIRVGRHLTPTLTTLRQPTEQIGETAARKLISLIENPSETRPETVVVKGRLYEGGSVAKL